MEAGLGPGARGRGVEVLQRYLRRFGYLPAEEQDAYMAVRGTTSKPDPTPGLFDDVTTEALRTAVGRRVAPSDSDSFHATMRTGSHYYLIRGQLSSRRAEVLRDHVESPSLSPDGRLIAYKSRIEHGFDPATWQLRVLDVATLNDRPLAETRNVDDQVAWLDDAHIVYAIEDRKRYSSGLDTWVAPADGSGAPQLLIPSAESPVPVQN